MRVVRLGIAWCGGIGLLLLGALVGLSHAQDPLPPGVGLSPRALATRVNRLQGAGSCSAVACHGGGSPGAASGVLQNEHTTWIADDPHALAFQTLYSDRSERIVRKLAGRSAEATPAHQDRRCLACHATPRPVADLKETAWMNQDGVSCEACHGPAEKWIGPHTASWWKDVPPETRESRYGFRQTKDLARRAATCAECHVGRRGSDGSIPMDVNHDLIAAGHPRLNFEFAAYSDNLPPHWTEKGRNASPDFPALAWSVGQVATTKAAIELLRGRAEIGGATWPEFSEYGCFSCHHELADEPWRRNRPVGAARETPPGAPRWGSWYLPMSRSLALEERTSGRDPGGDWTQFEAAIKQLVGEMSKPSPDSVAVREIAGSAIRPLERRLETASARAFSATDVERILKGINDPDSWKAVESWDHAAQRYLAIVPFRQSWTRLAPDRRGDHEALKLELDALRDRLKFDEARDSPRRGFAPATLRDHR